MALVTVDGGTGYWNPHPGDNPQAMLTDEVIPLCLRRGLGAVHRIGVMGISMGGYGALLLAEKRPDLISAAAAISPAIWTSYAQARAANAGAYASAADFAADDAVTHAGALSRVPVRIAAGFGDPFYPGVQALARALPKRTGGQPPVVTFANGCHDSEFFTAQEPASLAFLARHLTPQSPAPTPPPGESGGKAKHRAVRDEGFEFSRRRRAGPRPSPRPRAPARRPPRATSRRGRRPRRRPQPASARPRRAACARWTG